MGTRSVTVTASDTPLTITVRYAANKEGEEEVVVKEVGEGETVIFEEMSEDMGSWQQSERLSLSGERLREEKNLKRSVRKIVKGSMETFTTLRIRKEPLGSS